MAIAVDLVHPTRLLAVPLCKKGATIELSMIGAILSSIPRVNTGYGRDRRLETVSKVKIYPGSWHEFLIISRPYCRGGPASPPE
ncbi:hypothetical protein Desti_0452 [Desulfomonile tiedjei DSM 6799]|uniref:Uncharacterized protein n=1 Tax=Desulfomonile tiedjei (strain ATCC 49306 / DSM 6799 / DCB-1) TaxID=706587 RepID=I4C0U6_DESTA|nr:hypothetical protein Desti_0452 [Desulfomonile tiedjei DSM 6799]